MALEIKMMLKKQIFVITILMFEINVVFLRLSIPYIMEMILNQISKKSIEKQTGLSWSQIVSMDVEELDKAIERKIGKKLSFPKKRDLRLPGRGSVYLALNRFFDFNHKKMNKIIDSISIE